jgi:hypothetical protein
LLRPYERRVYAAVFAILRNEADAEEVAQEAVVKASPSATVSGSLHGQVATATAFTAGGTEEHS